MLEIFCGNHCPQIQIVKLVVLPVPLNRLKNYKNSSLKLKKGNFRFKSIFYFLQYSFCRYLYFFLIPIFFFEIHIVPNFSKFLLFDSL